MSKKLIDATPDEIFKEAFSGCSIRDELPKTDMSQSTIGTKKTTQERVDKLFGYDKTTIESER